MALTKEKNMEDNYHCNTSRRRLCSSHLNKNLWKNSTTTGFHFEVEWKRHFLYAFCLRTSVIFFSDQAAFPKALSTSILNCLSLKKHFVYNFCSFIETQSKEVRLVFQRAPIYDMHTKRTAMVLSYFVLFQWRKAV